MNTRTFRNICAALLVTGLLQACASNGATAPAPAPEPPRGDFGIEKGRTTKVELLALLGPPDEARQVGAQEAWWYTSPARKARDQNAQPGGGAGSGAAGAVGKSMAMGGLGVILGQIIPGGSNLGGAVASGMARSGIMSAGSQAINKGGEAIRARDEAEARQTLVILFEGDVVHDYALSERGAAAAEPPSDLEVHPAEAEKKER